MSKVIQPTPGLRPRISHPRNDQQLAWWLFNEGDGKVVNDLVKQQNGDIVNGPSWQEAPFGNSLKFNGSDQYVNTSLTVAAQAYTICLWVKKDGTNRGWFVAQRSDGGNTFQFWGRPDSSDQLMHYFNGSTTVDSTVTIPSDTWTHIAVVHDGSEVHFYKDGVFDVTRTLSLGSSSTETVQLMTDTFGNFANGAIQDARVWQRALSSDEIKFVYEQPYIEFKSFSSNLTIFARDIGNVSNSFGFSQSVTQSIDSALPKTGKLNSELKPVIGQRANVTHPRVRNLVSWWLFNEGDGKFINDYKDQRILEAQSTLKWSASDHGHALEFQGKSNTENEYLELTDGNFLPENKITVAFWMKADSGTQGTAQLSWNPDTTNELSIKAPWSDNNFYFTYGDGSSGGEVSFDFSSFLDQYVHVACVATSGRMAVYVNGTLQVENNSATAGIDTSISTKPLRFGILDPSNSNYSSYDGLLEDIRLYDRDLTDPEIRSLKKSPFMEFEDQMLYFLNTDYYDKPEQEVTFTQAIERNIDHARTLTNSITFTGIAGGVEYEPSVSNSFSFTQEIIRQVDIEHEIQFTQSARRPVDATASNSFTFTQEVTEAPVASNIITFTDAVVIVKSKGVNHSLIFTQTVNGSRFDPEPTPSNNLTFTSRFTYRLETPVIDQKFNPQTSEYAATATPPNLTHNNDFKLKSGETIINLPTPEFGNTERFNQPTAINFNRSQSIGKCRQSYWTSERKMEWEFANVKEETAKNLLDFLENNIGQAIIVHDHDDKCWSGVIVNPETAVAENVDGRYSVSINFEVEESVVCDEEFDTAQL